MEELFNNLPIELKNKIMLMTYKKQDKKLLDDIENYKKVRETIIEKYLEKGYTYNEDESNVYDWVENDISSYWNDNKAYMNELTENNMEKMKRLTSFNILANKNKVKAIHDFHTNLSIASKTRFNRYIGGLTIQERTKFIDSISAN